MILLPGFFCFLFLKAVSAEDTASDVENQILECPGTCVPVDSPCDKIINGTNCGDYDYECCVEDFDKTTFDSVEWGDSTEAPEVSTTVQDENYLEVEDGSISNLYAEETDFPEFRSEFEGPEDENCPGACVPSQYSEFCEYVIPSNDICTPESTCCITADAATSIETRMDYDEIQQPSEFRSYVQGTQCPGTCVQAPYSMFCERILAEYPCPMNGKCCLKRSEPKVIPGSAVIECTGQCLASNLHGYCFPPNRLIAGATTCARGTTCCMRDVGRQGVVPPGVDRVKYPDHPLSGSDRPPSTSILGYLARDDNGNMFKVSADGQATPLPVLTAADHAGRTFYSVSHFESAMGKVVVFADEDGELYQQLFSKSDSVPSFDSKRKFASRPSSDRNPLQTSASEMMQKFEHASMPVKKGGDIVQDNSETVVIPDDDDDAPVSLTTSMPQGDKKLIMPQCPGSCMSYFLRFTCFRGYAIYDGFSCPGRQVCCASLKDIEEHESYLKSLSPYFNTPPASRDQNLPRCGIKGRRDTPRVIGGKDSLAGEWCWHVAIINMQNQYICGGAIIDDSWVLTAAHCVATPLRENRPLYVRAGVTDLKSPEDNAAGQTIRVLSTFVHHNFKSVNLDNDIALLRLQKPVKLGNNVCVICLPTSGHMPKENSRCTVTGYGFVPKAGTLTLRLREAKIPIVHDMDCMSNLTDALGSAFILPSSSFCAGGRGQQDACQGDAGGPLVCEVGGYYEVVGLVSWSLGCGRSDVPSLYVKVPSFMGWINQIISSSSFVSTLR